MKNRDWFLFIIGIMISVCFCSMGVMFSYYSFLNGKDFSYHVLSVVFIALGLAIYFLFDDLSLDYDNKKPVKK